MPEGAHDKRFDAVLVIDADALRRVAVEWAFWAAGFSVVAVGSIAEVEQWPEGQLVITDLAHVSPWWRQVGALEVVALVADAGEGRSALSNGATLWLQLPQDPAAVATTLLALVHRATGPASCKTINRHAGIPVPQPRWDPEEIARRGTAFGPPGCSAGAQRLPLVPRQHGAAVRSEEVPSLSKRMPSAISGKAAIR